MDLPGGGSEKVTVNVSYATAALTGANGYTAFFAGGDEIGVFTALSGTGADAVFRAMQFYMTGDGAYTFAFQGGALLGRDLQGKIVGGFDVDEDLYGKHLRVQLIEFLRPERRFDGLDALKAQIALDAEAARRALATGP